MTSRAHAAGPMLREASVKVTFTNTTTCEVDAAFAVVPGTATALEHRLQLFEGTRVDVLGISGAALARPPYTAGRTEVLQLLATSPTEHRYSVRYRVVHLPDQAYRCPLWLSTAPSDGQSLNVQVSVMLPAGATPSGGAFPALRWVAAEGVAKLGHVPAFVRVPFHEGAQSGPNAWNITRLMDGTAVVLLVAGMLAFIWRRRR